MAKALHWVITFLCMKSIKYLYVCIIQVYENKFDPVNNIDKRNLMRIGIYHLMHTYHFKCDFHLYNCN